MDVGSTTAMLASGWSVLASSRIKIEMSLIQPQEKSERGSRRAGRQRSINGVGAQVEAATVSKLPMQETEHEYCW